MTYPTNADLEAAVIARADEDTPRLAYADWLDDHGDPVRAEWIRVQCRFADLSPAAPDWLDLRERQAELACLLKHRHLTDLGDEGRFHFFGQDALDASTRILDEREEPFRRGFPFTIVCRTVALQWTLDETRRAVRDFTKLASETPLRGLRFYSTPVAYLTEFLRAPVCPKLRALELEPQANYRYRSQQLGEFFTFLGTNPLLRGLQKLFLHGELPESAVSALARATAFGSLRRLDVGLLRAPAAELTKFGGSRCVRGLRSLHVSCASHGDALLKPLATSTELHALELPQAGAAEARGLAAGKWPALARLNFGGALSGTSAKLLAKAKFPALVEFHNASAARNDDLKELLKGGWVERLRVLNLRNNSIGDAGVKALAAHPVARELRHLHLGDNAFGKGGLMAIATGFPALTVLDLGSSLKRKATEADVAAFVAALSAPLRHLNLHGWPLGDAGAQSLAANPALAGLTRLNVDGCKIGDAGVKALLASPHLRNLVDLRIDGNDYKPAATNALADPTVLPNLGECWADGSERLRKTVATARPRLYLIV